MLADGDAATAISDAAGSEDRAGGRLRLLPRYHLENYFLDEHVLAAVFAHLEAPLGSWLREPARIRETVKELAGPFVSYGAALRVTHRLRMTAGNVDLMPKGCHGLSIEDLVGAFEARRSEERDRLDAALSATVIPETVRKEFMRLNDALVNDSETWKHDLPGRPILNTFAAKAGLDVGTLKRLYIKCAQKHEENPFSDIRNIFNGFARFGSH